MKSEQEVRQALEAFKWYAESGRLMRQDYATRQNVVGTLATLDWILGTSDPTNPIAGVLGDIRQMRPGSN